jgi:hypothetical protein
MTTSIATWADTFVTACVFNTCAAVSTCNRLLLLIRRKIAAKVDFVLATNAFMTAWAVAADQINRINYALATIETIAIARIHY